MERVRCIAVDWSGAIARGYQREHIWLAVAEPGRLIRLEHGLTRDEVVATLVNEIQPGGPVAIGLDFAFSFPQWYLERRNRQNVRALWDLAAGEGEQWLAGDTCPFWGRPGPYEHRPENLTVDLQFRETDEEQMGRGQPKSVFKVNGAGAVGTGTIRGLPALARLQDAGATIWPFDAPNPGRPNVIEIYPRVFYGGGVINNGNVRGRDARGVYLERNYAGLEQHWRDTMTGSGDAFDAGVSALVMSTHAGDLQILQQAVEPRRLMEGEIWSPAQPG